MQLEKRAFGGQLSAAGRKLSGLAAPFGIETRVNNFTEVIRRGAFAASLARGGDILALADHDPAKVLARTKSGTLQLRESEEGLHFDLQLPDTQAARDILVLAERGDIGGMSFGFTVPDGGEQWSGTKRTLTNVNLHEISVVSAVPAYPTHVQARNFQGRTIHYYRLRLLELNE